jgi:hypothetical protein
LWYASPVTTRCRKFNRLARLLHSENRGGPTYFLVVRRSWTVRAQALPNAGRRSESTAQWSVAAHNEHGARGEAGDLKRRAAQRWPGRAARAAGAEHDQPGSAATRFLHDRSGCATA